MTWYNGIDTSIVIILLIILISFYIIAIRHDYIQLKYRHQYHNEKRAELDARYKQAIVNYKLYGGTISDHYNINNAEKSRIREIVLSILEEQNDNELWVKKLVKSSKEGFVIGFLGGAMIGGINSAISGAFTWSIVNAVITGLPFVIND